jgi:hypothetical protein
MKTSDEILTELSDREAIRDLPVSAYHHRTDDKKKLPYRIADSA